MNKYIVLCLCVSLNAVLCVYTYGKEGDDCEWEGLKGRCVKETRCLTTLDDDSPKHPVCSRDLGEKIICCTDCNLVNNTKNAVFIPPSGLVWKNGQKARDNCLQYLQDLPYKCKEDDFSAGITRVLDEDHRCYAYNEWDMDSSSSELKKPRAAYPHRVLLGYVRDGSGTNSWESGGFIISDKYIVTTQVPLFHLVSAQGEKLKFIAVGVSNHRDSTVWQTHLVKRFILHPEFDSRKGDFNNIALIETETRIKFNENVLPACLHVEEDASVEEAIITTPWSIRCDEVDLDLMDRIKAVENMTKVKKCNENYDKETQIYYELGIVEGDPFDCLVVEQASLMITTQYSSCVHTAIGVSMQSNAKIPHRHIHTNTPLCHKFTRIAHYVPWIESIVWPDE